MQLVFFLNPVAISYSLSQIDKSMMMSIVSLKSQNSY